MANTLVNGLFPPSVATFMPAFVRTSPVRIYYSLSPYNEISKVRKVHVSVVNQKTNENVVNNSSGILLIPNYQYEPEKGLYYVEINPGDIRNGTGTGFNSNQFYKVQLRFDQNEGDIPTDNSAIALNNYFLEHQTDFSEWSSVCLIRPIDEPLVVLNIFDNISKGSVAAFNKGIIPIVGRMVFVVRDANGNIIESKTETETLQSYKVQVLDKDTDEVLLESKTIYTGDQVNPNEINYKFDIQGLDTSLTSEFKLNIIATTKNQYQYSKKDPKTDKVIGWPFQIADFLQDEMFDPKLEVKMNNETGIASLHIENDMTVFGTLYIKRASSIDNFKSYEDICIKKIAGPIDLTIYDNTVGSLVWYRYSVQMENSKGVLTSVYRTSKFLPDFYDAIISRGNQQLQLKYNYNVSSFKPVVNRAKVDTLGGRFPKFAENAVLNYKQFSITGLLSASIDQEQLFLNRKEYFDDDYDNYLIYNEIDKNGDNFGYRDSRTKGLFINKEAFEYNDFFWEREFREEAVKWLNDGEPKLYRSMTEGTMAVMLTDINLTPNKTLSRRMWDFSATVYEIADGNSLATLDSLGIYEIPKIDELEEGGSSSDDEYIEVIKVAQLPNLTISEICGLDGIMKYIQQQMSARYSGVLETRAPGDYYMKSVKLYFQSAPKAYIQDGNNFVRVSNYDSLRPELKPGVQIGYKFNFRTPSGSLNGTDVFVNDRGYYQIPDQLDIADIRFDSAYLGDKVTIEFVLVYKERNNERNIISATSVEKTLIGQESGVFKPYQYLGEKIRAKYNFVLTDQYVQKMQFWKGISLDVTPYSVVRIQYQGDETYNEYMIGMTGVLNLLKDFPIQDICFIGRRMKIEEKAERQPYLDQHECVRDEGTYSSINDITNPSLGTIYSIGDKEQIYFNNQWYNFTTEENNATGIMEIPVEGSINYYGQVIKQEF